MSASVVERPTRWVTRVPLLERALLVALAGAALMAPPAGSRLAAADAKAATVRPAAKASRDHPFTNTLGMRFVPVPGVAVLFSVWETRVRDFRAFVDATGYDATGKMYAIGPEGWRIRDRTWMEPGFPQTANHPVCGVSFVDATRFCEWLTARERAAGSVGPNDRFRLPTDAEWSAAVGETRYPWGDDWPPPPMAGNYGDAESDLSPKILTYRDGYSRTAPVGVFSANRHGIHDLGGNVWEWCDTFYRREMNSTETLQQFPGLEEDGGGTRYRVLRGGSWDRVTPAFLESACRNNDEPDGRGDFLGFRVVFEPAGKTGGR
ncbi:MAG: SUMF1/EgtB/PvdO family nonheme iron enzyme [Verrucomicrobiae bacterium]|nr:SUMF1/EgtB/PvdO family nonheme iron enzyme [Verrucomicrobiae bacterium]